jgi:hypothetical protein
VRVLFDQGTPNPLRQSLTHHDVATAYERHWSQLDNGELLDAAEHDGFDVLISTDLNLKYQQNLKTRGIALIVLSTPSWPRIQQAVPAIVRAVDAATRGSYEEIDVP